MIWILLVLGTIAALLFVLNDLAPGQLDRAETRIELVQSLLILVLVGSSVLMAFRGRFRLAARYALAWVAIIAALFLGYSFRDEAEMIAQRMVFELVPSRAAVNADGSVSLKAASDGHFYADAMVNGVKIRFLVDTGASMISLAASDAMRLGIDPDYLAKVATVRTANGPASVARVDLDQVELGSIQLRDLEALVHQDGLDQSLLGMSFLDRLSGFERRGDRLTLIP